MHVIAHLLRILFNASFTRHLKNIAHYTVKKASHEHNSGLVAITHISVSLGNTTADAL